MNPRTLFFVLVFLFLNLYSVAQESELDKRNGFKEIKLAEPIDSVKDAKFVKDLKEKGQHVKLYTIDNPDYASIGEVKIESIEVKAYKGLVYEILVITEKDERLMKGMERAFGKPVYNVRDESYNWATKNIGLKFRSKSKSQLELFYSSNIVYKKMHEDKSKKIDDIASDF